MPSPLFTSEQFADALESASTLIANAARILDHAAAMAGPHIAAHINAIDGQDKLESISHQLAALARAADPERVAA